MPPAQNKTPSAPTLLAVVCVACCALAVQQASCRRVHRCFLARKLREAGFDRYHILHYLRRRLVGYYVWAETGLLRKGPGYGRYIRLVYRVLCVANMVSKFNMTMQVKREGGQRTVGIFQLASQFFCFDNYKPGMRNGRCHELCDAFLDENLEDDIRCAALVRHLWGFKYWTGWEQKCLYGKVSPFLEGCDYEN
ncbi:lysozyme C-1-like isoform X4 [Dermacentor variabilis]|uniref:lysozyme C-1-like isoform X4 n=1 Tax=Dermacentor variabilis TaxID=34621 RepID=UPI003F5B4532